MICLNRIDPAYLLTRKTNGKIKSNAMIQGIYTQFPFIKNTSIKNTS